MIQGQLHLKIPLTTLIKLLEEGKVIIYPGGLYGDHCDDFVRFSLTQPANKIKEAVSRIKKVVSTI